MADDDGPPPLDAEEEEEEEIQTRPAAPRPSFLITGNKKARALIDYTGKSERELTFKKGDIIAIIGTGTETDTGFFAGAMRGAFGVFPSSAVELIEAGVAEPPAPKPVLPPITNSPLPERKGTSPLPCSPSPLGTSSTGTGSGPIVPPPDAPAGERNDRMRAEVLKELITTERDYVRDLDTAISVFLIPLRATNIIPADQINQIFSSLELIVEVNREVLKELESRQKDESADVLVGDVFTKMSNYFKMYVSYCSNQQASVAALEKCQSQKQIKAFLDICHSDPKCKGLQILSFLIKPIQRICKYPLLFRELLKYTPSDHPDYKQLLLAQQKLDEVATYVNEGKRYSEGLSKVIEIQQHVMGCETLITPSRIYVREGAMKGAVGKEKLQPRQVYLFNDMVMLARAKGAAPAKKGSQANLKKPPEKSLYECRAQFMLEKAKLVNVSDTKVIQHAFEIHADKRVAVFVCVDEKEKNSWLRDIKALLKEFQKKQLMEMKRQSSIGGGMTPRTTSAIF